MSSSLCSSRDQLRDRPEGDDPSAVDDRRRVARLLDLVEQVRGEEHRPALADQRADHLAELEDAGRVEAVRRLVEDQQLRVGEQAARDAEALAHALRVGRHPLVGALGEADARERAVDPGERLGPAHGGDDPKVLAPGEVVVEVRLLDDRADARERFARVAPGTGRPRRCIAPASARVSPSSMRIVRGLAGAVVAEEAEGAAARDAQRHAVDRDTRAEALGQVLRLDDAGGRS